MRRIIKHLETHDFLSAYHKLDTVQTRLARICLQAGLRLTTTSEYVIDGGFTLHYDVSYNGEVGSIFSGNLVIGDEYNFERLLDILCGKLTSEVCPPAIKSIPREDQDPEIVSYWRRRLIVEQDITHVGSRKEQTTAAQSAAWLGFNAKGEEITRVVDGSRNHYVHQIKRIQYVDMGNGDVVVAVMYRDDEPKDEKNISLGQAIELSEKQAKAKKEEVTLPPILKASEYDTLDQKNRDEYNASISKVAHAIIQDVAGVVRDGNPEHLKWLRRVLDNGHMESEAIGSVEDSKFNSKTIRDYMVEKLQISAVMLQSMYPNENIIDKVDSEQDSTTLSGVKVTDGESVQLIQILEDWFTAADMPFEVAHADKVAVMITTFGKFPGLTDQENLWLFSSIAETNEAMGTGIVPSNYLAQSEQERGAFLQALTTTMLKRNKAPRFSQRMLKAFENTAVVADGLQAQQRQFKEQALELLNPFKPHVENFHMHAGWVANAVASQGFFKDLDIRETYWLYSLLRVAGERMSSLMFSINAQAYLELSEENQKTFKYIMGEDARKRGITIFQLKRMMAAFDARVEEVRTEPEKLANGEPVTAPTRDIVKTARDWAKLPLNVQHQYGTFVRFHAGFAAKGMQEVLNGNVQSVHQARSRVVIERVLASKALSAVFRNAELTTQKTLEDFTAFYFRIPVDLVKWLKVTAKKPAVKRATARKKVTITNVSPKLWTLDKFNEQSDLVKNKHIEQWRAFMSVSMKTLNRVAEPEKQRSILSAVRFLVTAGYLAKQHKEDLSHLAQTSSVEWYTAQSFGIDKITFALASDLMDPPLSEKPPVKELPAKRGALQVTGRVPMKSVTIRNKATGVTLKVAAKKKLAPKK